MNGPTFIVNGHPFELIDMQAAMLVVFCMPNEGMVRFLGGDLNDIKRQKTKLCLLLDVPKPCALKYIAELAGFKLNGCYNGTMLFTKREQERVLKIAPWVEFAASSGTR